MDPHPHDTDTEHTRTGRRVGFGVKARHARRVGRASVSVDGVILDAGAKHTNAVIGILPDNRGVGICRGKSGHVIVPSFQGFDGLHIGPFDALKAGTALPHGTETSPVLSSPGSW